MSIATKFKSFHSEAEVLSKNMTMWQNKAKQTIMVFAFSLAFAGYEVIVTSYPTLP